MIIVDTNVWSEVVKASPDPQVELWMATHRKELALTSVTIGELLFGLEIMPAGRRKDALTRHFDRLFERLSTRIFPYDQAAARALATIKTERRAQGREVVNPEDAMIAAIAVVRGYAVATRNVADFDGMGVEVVNPWLN